MIKKNKIEQQKKKVKLPKLTFHKLDWLEWITFVIGIWFLFYPKPYTILFTILLIIPILGLFLNGLNGRPSISSLVEITKDSDGSDDYDVADFIDFPALVLLVRVLIDFEFESFYSLIIPGSITFIVVLLILFSTHRIIEKTQKSKLWIYSSIVFSIFLYSFSATYGINCVYDYSEPEVYDAIVIDKYISEGRKHKTFYIEITPWGHHYDHEKMSVSREKYGRIKVGQKVKIDYKKGLFNIPWYYIE